MLYRIVICLRLICLGINLLGSEVGELITGLKFDLIELLVTRSGWIRFKGPNCLTWTLLPQIIVPFCWTPVYERL